MSSRNLPDGVREGDPRAPWNEATKGECGTCANWSGHGDLGICCIEFDDELCGLIARTPKASAGAKIRVGAWWAQDWVLEHLKSETCEACPRWKEW